MTTAGTKPIMDDEAVTGLGDPEGLCLRVADAVPGVSRALIAAVGERLTTIILSMAGRPALIWTVAHAPLLVAMARADQTKPLGRELVATLREGAKEAMVESKLGVMRLLQCEVVAASRVARAVVTLGASGGREASARELGAALATLGATWEEQAARGATPPWLRTTLIAATMLEGILGSLGGGRMLTIPEEGTPESARGASVRRAAG